MKIAVIGGGVAGLYASLVAAEKGAQVTLWEKGKIGEGIVCGECIFDTLDCLPAPAFGMLHPVETLVLWEGEEEFRVPIGRYRKLWMMDRPSWQRGLAAHAAGRGVAIRERSAVSPHDLAHIAATHDWVLDASGAPSLTAKAYRFTAAYYQHFLIACQAKVAGDFSSLFPAIAAGFLPDLPASVMSSYFWIFPQRENQANVGFGLSGPFRKPLINPKRILRELMVARGLVPPEPPTLINGGLIPVQILPTLRYRNILLVGDAAGLASPLHGAGIDTAALSGILAVTVIHDDPQTASGYRERLLQALSARLACEEALLHLLRTGGRKEWRLLLQAAAGRHEARLRLALRHPDLLWKAGRWLKRRRPTELCSPALPWPAF